MAFSPEQTKALRARLDARWVRERIEQGQTLSYLEGWHVIAEANRLFGFDGWDRETVSLRCVWEGARQGRYACAYVAQVRIRVRAGETMVIRDGHGSGLGSGSNPGEAHEGAAKEAETDATKRALVTFGNCFGLCLYDKEQKGLRRRRVKTKPGPVVWAVRDPEGQVTQSCNDPREFCSSLRRLLEGASSAGELRRLWHQNAEQVSALKAQMPLLRTERGEHFADILELLFEQRRKTLEPAISQAELALARPRRVRNKEHLRQVAKQPCLVCGRAPAQAHHLKYLQPSGMGVKPSDEFAVPLCRIHHRAVHDHGDEKDWWHQQHLDPLPEAHRLWNKQGLKQS